MCLRGWRSLLRGTCFAVLLGGEGWSQEATRIDSMRGAQLRAPRSATAHTVEAVRWMSKRRQFTLRGIPYGVTGLPFVFFSPNTGWNYGVRLHWADYRRRPYRYRLTLHMQRSTEGKIKNRVRLKVPRISGTDFGLRLEFIRGRTLRTPYYGLGNNSVFNRDFTDAKSDFFKDENYYHYVLDRDPRILLSLLRQFYGPISISVGLGLERIEVEKRGEQAFYLEQGTPDGVVDGFSGFISATVNWDTRDDEVVPRRGMFLECSYESARNSLLGLFFEQIDFRRITFTSVHYIPLTSRWNFSHRLVLETLSGAVPLYAYGEIGGSHRVKGLGGSDSLRGLDTQRFTDDARFFSNTELRFHIYEVLFYRQHIEWQAAAFVDAGRVWPGLDELGLAGMHFSGGGELRLIWAADFVIRVGIGAAREQAGIWLSLGQSF